MEIIIYSLLKLETLNVLFLKNYNINKNSIQNLSLEKVSVKDQKNMIIKEIIIFSG